MPARLNPSHDKRTRDKIKTSQLINRLTKFVNGEVEMAAPQVTAALGLLKKTLPDLQSIDQTTVHSVDGSVAALMERIDGRSRQDN